ncbi:MAG: hypothetical protein PHH16_04025 [Candidatus Gracilibacteria bacterium]|nr:hypothetical protein [Candidatus Gracilibacteria bacterium]
MAARAIGTGKISTVTPIIRTMSGAGGEGGRSGIGSLLILRSSGKGMFYFSGKRMLYSGFTGFRAIPSQRDTYESENAYADYESS